MRASASACVSSQSYRVAGLYELVFVNQLFRHVAVDSLETVSVTDDDIFSISFTVISYHTHLSAECSPDSIADINLYVDSFMLTSPATSEVGSHYPIGRWHTEISQVNTECIWQHGSFVSVFVVPIFIEVSSRIFQLLNLHESAEDNRIDSFHFLVDWCLACQDVLSHRRDS